MNSKFGNLDTLYFLSLMMFVLTLQACGGGTSGAIPKTPTNFKAVAGDQRVTVTWNSVEEAASYNVYWSTTSGTFKSGTAVNLTETTFYHDGVSNGTEYFYVVSSINSAGESTTTSEISATPVDIFLSSLDFSDSNFLTCFNNATTTLVYVHDLESLSCGSKGITDIAGVEALSSLTYLLLDNNSITNVSAVKSLINLTYLNLSYNNTIEDVSAISGLTKLTILFLNENNITNIGALKNLTGLTWLQLDNNSIIDISSLNNLTNLTSLTLFRNSINEVDALTNITKLTSLNLQYNNIADVSGLAGLTNLVYLYLNDNVITNVKPLENLTKVKTLWLHNNNISGQGVGNIDSLFTLTAATTINISNNINMSCDELNTLIGALDSPPVNTDSVSGTVDVATNGANCTSP